MDQIFTVTLSEKVNERVYSLNLPIGAPWNEAVEVTKFFADAVAKLAENAEKQLQEKAAAQEPVEAVAEPVDVAPEPIADDSVVESSEVVEPVQEVVEQESQEA